MRFRGALVVGAVLLVVAIIAVLMRSKDTPNNVTVGVAFVGFTNQPSGLHAMFLVTNPPAASVSSTWFREETNGWRRMPGGLQWAHRDPTGLWFGVGVGSTNGALRFIHEFRERSTGPRRAVEQGREFIARQYGKPLEFFDGRRNVVTNEFRPATSGTTGAASVQL